jgi:hypothetical protein
MGHKPLPKPAEERVRRNAVSPVVSVASDAIERGPELPERYEWPPETREWWQNWRESPQAQTFTATDWDYLRDTALLHAALWDGDHSVESGLRLRVAKFGATPADRIAMRLTIDESAGVAAPQSSRKVAGQQARLLKATG